MPAKKFSWTDPYDKMSDHELDGQWGRVFTRPPRTVVVSLRVTADLLRRLKREAARAGVPYRTFLKGLVAGDFARLERGENRPRSAKSRVLR